MQASSSILAGHTKKSRCSEGIVIEKDSKFLAVNGSHIS